MVHAIRPVSRPHPDANRIAGLTVAIAVNAALLLLILVPMQAPPNVPREIVTRVWTIPAEKTPTPPTPPVHVDIAKPHPSTTPTRPAQQPQPPTSQEQVTDDQGTLRADTTEPVSQTTTLEPPSQPIPGVRLEYARAPAPAYPRDALRNGVTGTVLLQVLVDIDGRPLDVQIERSSGDRSLDRAAREQVLKHWLFRPAMRDGRAVQAIGLVPIVFSLG